MFGRGIMIGAVIRDVILLRAVGFAGPGVGRRRAHLDALVEGHTLRLGRERRVDACDDNLGGALSHVEGVELRGISYPGCSC